MAEYYLISQLPSLDGLGDNAPLPITDERFTELCERFLGKKALRDMKNITLAPTFELENAHSALINSWNDGERNLRLALCKARLIRRKSQERMVEGLTVLDSPLLQIWKVLLNTMGPCTKP